MSWLRHLTVRGYRNEQGGSTDCCLLPLVAGKEQPIITAWDAGRDPSSLRLHGLENQRLRSHVFLRALPLTGRNLSDFIIATQSGVIAVYSGGVELTQRLVLIPV